MYRKIQNLAVALVAAALVASCSVEGGGYRPQGAYWECDSQPNLVTTHPCDRPGRELPGRHHMGGDHQVPPVAG